MKKWVFAILFGSALVLGACGGEDEADDNGATNDAGQTDGNETVSSAEDLFEATCAACHGADLSGGAGPNLQTIGADYSSEEIKDIILNGTGSMPAQGSRVSDEDAQQIADWLAEKK
ncbi:cytochrome c551 [Ornithinibacillus contaminans]|uniref:cytochrome c551 n=1 Tax=Ornithinibacillus contaminans TaxID=694055 RepID=UPI00064D8BFD|nr:cytochrome c [Ornithinibacillus contaminans]